MSWHRCGRSVLALFTLVLMLAVPAGADPPIHVRVDGRELQFDTPPQIESGRTLVPLRAIFEALGAEVAWDAATQTVTAWRGGDTVALQIGATGALAGGRPVTLEAPARIVHGRTLVPLRFIGAALGARVEWDGATRTVLVTSAPASPAPAYPVHPDTDAAPTLFFSWGDGGEPGVALVTGVGQSPSGSPQPPAAAPGTGIALHVTASYRPYLSAAGGTVVALSRATAEGGMVAIRYGRRYTVVHRYVDGIPFALQEGDRIEPGTLLGYLGRNGDYYAWSVELVELQADGTARTLPPFSYFDAASAATLERARQSAPKQVPAGPESAAPAHRGDDPDPAAPSAPDPPSGQGQTAAAGTDLADSCGNDIGNGAEIVPGPAGPQGGDRDNPFRSLTVDPTNPDIVLVGTERNGFVRSSDGGRTWERLRYGLRHRPEGYIELYDIGIPASDPAVIYAVGTMGGPGPLVGDVPSAGGGVYKSTDGGRTWQRRNCGIADNGGRTNAVHVAPADPDRAIIGISAGRTSFSTDGIAGGTFIPGGLYRTVDGGEQWRRIAAGPGDDKSVFYQICAVAADPAVLYTYGNGIEPDAGVGFLRSRDGGATWEQFAPALTGVSYFDVSGDGQTIYAIRDTRDTTEIARSTDAGATWRRFPLRSSGYSVTVSPRDPRRVLYGQVDGLYFSADGLETSRPVIQIAAEQRLADVAFAPSNPDIVYAITQGYVLYRSSDGGQSFTRVRNIRQDVLNAQPPAPKQD